MNQKDSGRKIHVDDWRTAAAVVCNVIILVWTAFCVARFFVVSGDGNMQVRGVSCFRYFTVDSNILSAVAAAVFLAEAAFVCGGGRRSGSAATGIKQAGTSAVMVTLLTVLVYLGPVYGFSSMFAGTNLYMHLIGPLLSLFSFCVLERGGKITALQILLGVLPVVLYGAVYFLMVVVLGEGNGGWQDFYFLNASRNWYVSAAAFVAAALAVSFLTAKFHNAFCGK